MVVELLSPDDICDYFEHATYRKGSTYYKEGHVLELSEENFDNQIELEGFVMGSRRKPYQVHVLIDFDEDFLDISTECLCPVTYQCKHGVALLLCFIDHIKKKKENKPEPQSQKIIDPRLGEFDRWLKTTLDIKKQQKKQNIVEEKRNDILLYVIRQNTRSQHEELILTKINIELEIAPLLKKGGFGKRRRYDSSRAKSILSLDDAMLRHRLSSVSTDHYYDDRSISFSIEKCPETLFFDLIKTNRAVFLTATQNILLKKGEPRSAQTGWNIKVDGSQSFKFETTPASHFILITEKHSLYIDCMTGECGLITGVTKKEADLLPYLANMPSIPPQHVEPLREKLSQSLQIDSLPEILPMERKQYDPIPVATLMVRKAYGYVYNDSLLLELKFRYGSQEVNLGDLTSEVEAFDGKNIIIAPRHFEQEQLFINVLKKLNYNLAQEKSAARHPVYGQYSNLFLIEMEVNPNDDLKPLVISTKNKLIKAGFEVHIDKSCNIETIFDSFYADVAQTEGMDWFGFSWGVEHENQRVNLLRPVMKLLENGMLDPRKIPEEGVSVDLPDGTTGIIPSQQLKKILSVFIELMNPQHIGKEGFLKLSRYQLGHLSEVDQQFSDRELKWLGGKQERLLAEKLKSFTGIKSIKVPKNLNATLRPYQKEGLNWLQFLREYNFCGILADDMGLGKTIQTLALLLVEKNEKRLKQPALIIAPTSLMHNWQHETQKFAPSLKVLLLHGKDRKQHFDNIMQADLILTTYALVARDETILKDTKFHYLILDEAQYIKNSNGKIKKIIESFSATHRLCLTGTPMENHLGELWSLFHFLMPGFLGSLRHFSQYFRTPIEKHQDSERQKVLGQRIKPFLLRRTKDIVAHELPSKTEIIRTIQFEDEQAELYESIRIAMHEKIKAALFENGLAKSHIIILDALLKLRQVCCDPRLLKTLESAKAVKESAKLKSLMELLEGLLSENRKVLIFSSFTSMLDLIQDELNKLKISYLMLTGKTLDRASLIKKFQTGEVPIFLISLKAGGTGLNLTAADTVIHIDPWWNPAAENQATDRAHRIGQDKPVFVYKLIVENTVEEKILTLQAKKKNLVEGLLSEKQNAGTKLSKEDIEFLFET